MKTAENKILMIVIAIAGLSFLAWVILLYLAGETAGRIAQKSAELKFLNDAQAGGAMLSSSVIKTTDERAALDAYFYNRDSVLRLIELVEDVARRATVSLEFSDLQTTDNISFSLRTSGSLTATKEFLRLIENTPFLSRPEKITLQEKSIIDEEGVRQTSWVGDITLIGLSFSGAE